MFTKKHWQPTDVLKYLFFVLAGLITFSPKFSFAEPITDVSVNSIITLAMGPATNLLLTQATAWLGAFIGIQFVITNLLLLKSGADIEAIIGKLIGSLAWFGFCFYVLQNGPEFILNVGNQFFGMLGVSLPSPGGIMMATIGLVSTLAVLAAGVDYANHTVAQLVLYVLIFVFFVGMGFAVKIFLLQLELGLVVMLSPLSFSFLGLAALKEQGIAPFKALISLGYRILVITIILSAYTQVFNAFVTTLRGFDTIAIITGGVGLFFKTIMSAFGAYCMLGYLLYKSDAIAASIAGGHTSMGSGDGAGAAAMGGAVGGAMGAGAAGLAKAPTLMSDAISSMMTQGTIGNATQGQGTGGIAPMPIGTPPVRPPSPSMGPTNKNGAPIRPEPAASSTAPSQASSGNGAGSTSPEPAGSSKTGDTSPAGAGSGQSAGIGGGSKLEDKLDKLVDTLGGQQQGGGRSFSDHLQNVNQHVANEKVATHVTIGTNAE